MEATHTVHRNRSLESLVEVRESLEKYQRTMDPKDLNNGILIANIFKLKQLEKTLAD